MNKAHGFLLAGFEQPSVMILLDRRRFTFSASIPAPSSSTRTTTWFSSCWAERSTLPSRFARGHSHFRRFYTVVDRVSQDMDEGRQSLSTVRSSSVFSPIITKSISCRTF